MIQLNPIKAIKYQLYLFQLENYRVGRFLRFMLKNFSRPKIMPRKKLVWTLKIVYLLLFAVLLQTILALIVVLAAYYKFRLPIYSSAAFGLAIYYFLSILFFIVLIFAAILYYPLDCSLKRRIINKAKAKMAGFRNVKVIAIAGSYGKTTFKEILAAILAEKFNVLKTPENINTPVGISRLILEKLDTRAQIFIVEMGAYKKGDINELCKITKPDIGVLTGINESHLERFGSLENTIAAKFEVIDNVKDGGLVVINADDALAAKESARHLENKTVFFYSSCGSQLAAYSIADKSFFKDGSGLSFTILEKDGQKHFFKVPFLGEYAIGMVSASRAIARELGVSDAEIKRGAAMLKPIAHRLQPIAAMSGVFVIDDSYNGNPDGARGAINVLARFEKRRKIYLTPGLVETGEKTEEIHYKIGEQLSGVADVVILIKNSVTGFIAQGLEKNGFNKNNIFWFDTAAAAHAALPRILKSGDVIIFQNDWPDNYF